MDIDIFTQTLVAAVPVPVQEFLTSPQWDVDDLVAFQSLIKRMGL